MGILWQERSEAMRWSLGSVLTVALLAGCGVAHAQGAATAGPATAEAGAHGEAAGQGETGTTVVRAARLTYVSGAVTLQRADNTAEDAPVVNTPLYAGTRIVTGDYGQAEVEFEDGSVTRVTPRSALSLDALGVDGASATTEMTLLGGLAYFELRKTVGMAYRVTAGEVVGTPVENVSVRVSLDDGPAVFAVLTGGMRLEREKGFSALVTAGESLRMDGEDESRYYLSDGVAEQSWDRWNEDRDAVAADEADRRTTARDGFAGSQGYGWSDLDANGTWYEVSGQGMVWQPDVADEGFDPYGYGEWVYGNVGYVFVPGYSWGWTPYRCGRWGWFKGFGWGWTPGSSCGSYGFGASGWDAVRVGHGPPHYRPILKPLPGLGGVHPIVKVLGPDGPRPPVHPGGPERIAGVIVTPVVPVGGRGPRSGSMVGQALNRDFPVDRNTGVPLLGVRGVVRPVPGEAVGGSAWTPVEGKEERVGKKGVAAEPVRGTSERQGEPAAGGGSRDERLGGSPATIRSSPAIERGGPVRVPSVQAPVRDEPARPVRSEPAPVQIQPRPVRTGPPPAPVSVRVAPAPAPSAPAQNKPK